MYRAITGPVAGKKTRPASEIDDTSTGHGKVAA